MSYPLAIVEDITENPAPGCAVRSGQPYARLLAGPSSELESLEQHVRRLGRLRLDREDSSAVRSLIRDSGIVGRGGGEFPLSRKVDLAAASPGVPLIVVNSSEGEPASRKDSLLATTRPHLILDGAAVVARATGADTIVVYVHSDRDFVARAYRAAIAERCERFDEPPIHLVEAPDHYVAGEASSVVNFLGGGDALPSRSPLPPAASGVHGRPTVVSNAETYAHVGLVGRFGSEWFREAGTPEIPGSTLVTFAGSVPVPGMVVEILRPMPLGDVFAQTTPLARVPAAVLFGGYGGTWVQGKVALATPIARHTLRQVGAPLGCGLVAVLAGPDCGVAETARLLQWMAGESAGQCGPCRSGLPEIAGTLAAVAAGTARSRSLRRLRELSASVRGRGACGHPTGAANLLDSALEVFADEFAHHVRGRTCAASGRGLPLRHHDFSAARR